MLKTPSLSRNIFATTLLREKFLPCSYKSPTNNQNQIVRGTLQKEHKLFAPYILESETII